MSTRVVIKHFLKRRLEQRISNGESLDGIDLRGANLTGIDLRGASMKGCNLSFSRMTGARLDDADLSDSHLWMTDLKGASMTTTNLTNVDMDYSNLEGVSMKGALVRRTQLPLDFIDADSLKLSLENGEAVRVKSVKKTKSDPLGH